MGAPEEPTSRLAGVALFAATIAVLYFARDVLIPLALAILLSFLLAPAVSLLRHIRVPRVVAVLLVVLTAFLIIGGIGFVVSNQIYSLALKLPDYRVNIQHKIASIRSPVGMMMRRVVEDFSSQISSTTATTTALGPAASQKPSDVKGRNGQHPAPAAGPGAQDDRATTFGRQSDANAMPVRIVDSASSWRLVWSVVGPIIEPIGRMLIVIVLVIFMLMQQQDLQDRLIRLVGQSRVRVTTDAMDDAARRVSRYLLTQVVVNTSYGVLLGLGLRIIGVPNALLWGVLVGVMRFLPYIGTWLAASLPILLSMAVFDGWTRPLMTFGLFLAIDLIIANVIEPLVYGARTGISSLAVLLAAIFWTWLWGPLGLVLSTPMTVCLAVIGRNVPQLEFLHILLGDDSALSPEVQLYQRLLAADTMEASEVAADYLKERSLLEVYDTVLIPALALVEADCHRGALDAGRQQFIHDAAEELIQELSDDSDRLKKPASDEEEKGPAVPIKVVCLAAHSWADELCAFMTSEILRKEGYDSMQLPADTLVSEKVAAASVNGDVACISALPPFATRRAKYICKRLNANAPGAKVVVCLWKVNESRDSIRQRMEGADAAATSLPEALEEVRRIAAAIAATRPDQARPTA